MRRYCAELAPFYMRFPEEMYSIRTLAFRVVAPWLFAFKPDGLLHAQETQSTAKPSSIVAELKFEAEKVSLEVHGI